MDELVVGIVCTLLGVISGGFITYKYSLGLIRKQELLKAGIAFKEAFLDVLKELESETINQEVGKPGYAIDIIESSFSDHEKAWFRFREYLPMKKRSSFKDAWHQYICKRKDDHDNEFLFLDYHVDEKSSLEKEIEKRQF